MVLTFAIQERDAGIYECQIPTQPPQAYQIKLNVIGNYFSYISTLLVTISAISQRYW